MIHLSLEYKSVTSRHQLHPGDIPLLSTMSGLKVLQVVNHRDSLRLGSSKEVVLDRIRAVPKISISVMWLKTSNKRFTH